MYSDVSPQEVMSFLQANSGLTFPELGKLTRVLDSSFGRDYMDLINCLWTLAGANLITVDGFEGTSEALVRLLHNEAILADDKGKRRHRKIRATNHFLEVQHALAFDLPGYPSNGRSSWNYSFLASPIFGNPVRTPKVRDIFVIMPFAGEFLPLYLDHIAPTVSRASLSVMRADDLFTSNAVIADVWSAIYHSQAIIADCTGRNPNVFYELGIAHTVGKPTILITQNREDVPIDVRHIKYIAYDFTPRGTKLLEAALSETLASLALQPRIPVAKH